jgi:hypothetical protein
MRRFPLRRPFIAGLVCGFVVATSIVALTPPDAEALVPVQGLATPTLVMFSI